MSVIMFVGIFSKPNNITIALLPCPYISGMAANFNIILQCITLPPHRRAASVISVRIVLGPQLGFIVRVLEVNGCQHKLPTSTSVFFLPKSGCLFTFSPVSPLAEVNGSNRPGLGLNLCTDTTDNGSIQIKWN